MRIPEADVQAIKEKADIVEIISQYLPLEKQGKEYVGVCPFHDDHSPSMRVSPDKQIFKCFACGAGGDAIGFVSKYEKISFVDAVAKVAARIHYPLQIEQAAPAAPDTNKPLYDALDLFTAYGRYELASKDGQAARNYLVSRKFNKQILDTFQIGYAPSFNMVSEYLQARFPDPAPLEKVGLIQVGKDRIVPCFHDRILIPIHDAKGNPVGYTARIVPPGNSGAKYVNTSNSVLYQKSNLIFNYHRAARTAHKAGRVILCEGAMDVLGLAKAGISEGIANLGTACTDEQLNLIARLRVPVVVFYDQDAAGQKAAYKFGRKAMAAGIRFSIVSQKEAKDPDDIFIQKGAEAVHQAVDNTISFAQFCLEYLQTEYNLDNYEDKKQYAREMEGIIRASLEQFEQPVLFSKLQQLTGFSFEANPSPRRSYSSKKSQMRPAIPLQTLPAAQGRLQAEKAVLWSMLNDENYIRQYQNEVGVFANEDCQKLALYIQSAYQNHRQIDPVELFSIIEEESVRGLLAELAEWPDYSESTHGLFSESVVKIKYEFISHQIDELNRKMKTVQNMSDMKTLMNQKRELIARRNSLKSRKVV